MVDATLKKAGLKTTVPRMTILKILEDNTGHHLSAEDIYRRLLAAEKDVGLATVYRVLTQFEAAGLVIRHNFDGGQSVYEIDKGGPHDHIVCIKCGYVEEFTDPLIAEQQQRIAKNLGFSLKSHSLYLYGICKRCR